MGPRGLIMSLQWSEIGTICPRLFSCKENHASAPANRFSGMDMVNAVTIQDSPQAAAVAGNNGQRIGHVYKKVLYREYTDGSFTVEAPRPKVRETKMYSRFASPDFFDSGWACLVQ